MSHPLRQDRRSRRLRIEPLEDRRLLAGVTVGNNLDVVNGVTTSIVALIAMPGADGISLREAILAANATAGADTITFAPSMSGQTITLGGSQLEITEALTIDASPLAQNVTINANLQSRVMEITASSGDFTLAGLNLTRGQSTASGGAISSDSGGLLTLLESTVDGNTAVEGGGGISASGAVTLMRSTVSGNNTTGDIGFGGGVLSLGLGSVKLNSSTVSGNRTTGFSALGGGIFSSTSVFLSHSTVSGNFTTGMISDGGGIVANDSVTLSWSTVTGNSAQHSSSRGGGVYLDNGVVNDPILVKGSIVAGNAATTGPDVFSATGMTPTINYSVLGTGVAPIAGGNNVVTNNPLLGPLANNGGPTLTHALLAGSPAFNAGDPATFFPPGTFDQRGAPFARVFGGRIDIGAFEQGNLIVDSTSDMVDGVYGPGQFSLREAILLANARPGADTITFASGMSGQTITLGGTSLAITEALTVDAAPLAANVTVDANLLSRVFNISAISGNVTLAGLNITGGRTTADVVVGGEGGAIRSTRNALLTLRESTVSGSGTAGFAANGGGVFAVGDVWLENSTVSGNNTAGPSAFGGGIYVGGNTTLLQSTVSGNGTLGQVADGGGVYALGAVTITQSTVTGNFTIDSTSRGGGLLQFNGGSNLPLSISGSIIADNAAAMGRDVFPDPQSALTVNDSLIGTGVAPTAGGNNVVTNNPLLGPLADNGGPTPTHALLAGSPAFNAGDPTVVFNAAEFDQRGTPFARVAGGRIDIGAFEHDLVVDTNSDVVDGSYGPGQFSLREAIGLANTRPGVDFIGFASALSGQTITLGGTQLDVTEAVTIDARPLAQNVTIDANLQSRALRIDDPNTATESFAVTLAGLNFVNGRTAGPSPGGAIRSLTSGLVTLSESTVADSRTADADGGGVWAPNLRFERSTVSGNETRGTSASGGGVWATTLDVDQSTLSGNSTLVDGGGAYVEQALTINQSTITLNTAGNRGAGVFRPNSAASYPLTISGSILAANAAPSAPDLRPGTGSVVTANYSLFGDATGSGVTAGTGTGNLRNVSAQLGPLADNGGPTRTHALLTGSPARNAGDPAIVFNATQFDQRGTPFARVFGGRIDIGAFEVQQASFPIGDYNRSGSVTTADHAFWATNFGATTSLGLQADGNNDGAVDAADYTIWRDVYTPPASAAVATAAVSNVVITLPPPTETLAKPNAARQIAPSPARRTELLLAARQAAFAELGEEVSATSPRMNNSRTSTLRGERAVFNPFGSLQAAGRGL